MPRPDYARIGEAIKRFGGDSDVLVGKALDQVDWLLNQAGYSWEKLGKDVAGLAMVRSQAASRPSSPGNGARPPSQWKLDKNDVTAAYERREELDDWAQEFLANIYRWCVDDGKGLTPAQRDKLHEQLDKLGL